MARTNRYKQMIFVISRFIALVLLLVMTYKSGVIRGSFDGITYGLHSANHSMCESMELPVKNVTYDNGSITHETCVLGGTDIRETVHCGRLTLVTNGTEERSMLGKVLHPGNAIILYPFLGCWW